MGTTKRNTHASENKRAAVEQELRRVEKSVSEPVRRSAERITKQYSDTLRDLSKT